MRDNNQEILNLKKKDKDKENTNKNQDKSNSDLKTIIKFKNLIEANDIEELNTFLGEEDIKEQTLSVGLNIALEQYRSSGNSIDIIDSLLK
jgi:hypothetical protein